MKKIVISQLFLCMMLMLSGCIVSSNPDEEIIAISPGETVFFDVTTSPANENVTWYVDDVEVQDGGKEYNYFHDAKDLSEEHVVTAKASLVPVNNTKTWTIRIPKLSPVLEDLSVKGCGKTSVTLNEIALSQKGNPEPSIFAYIGEKGDIAEEDGLIVNYNDVSDDLMNYVGTFRFDDLDANGEYTIYVVAENELGYSVKSIDVDMSEETVINLDDYQEMTEEEIGHLLWAKKISDLDVDDFSLIPSVNVMGIPLTGDLQLGPASHRYVLAFSTYFMATEQFHKLPACTEIIQPIFYRYLEKMLAPRVWTYWSFTSQGIVIPEPGTMTGGYPSERDPVVRRNIMYSGHLAHMMSLYEKFYDAMWTGDNAGQFTGPDTALYELHFDENENIIRDEVQELIEHKDYTVEEAHTTFRFKWDDTEEEYRYNLPALLQVLWDQIVFMKDNCIECEPNCCFAPCNTHAPEAFILHDQKFDSNFTTANDFLMDWYLGTRQFDPVTHEVAHFWLVKQEKNITSDDVNFENILSLLTATLETVDDFFGILNLKVASLSAWTGTFLNTWQPEYIQLHYPYQKESKIKYYGDGKARVVLDWLGEQYSNGFFAMWAAEMGDSDLRDMLVTYTEELYDPVWEEDGSFHYPNGIDWVLNILPLSNPISMPLTGKLVALARAIPPGGISKMHNYEFTGKNDKFPHVYDVDFPNVVLKRAIYDESKEALIVSTVPGALNEKASTSVMVKNLDTSRNWTLYEDGISKGDVDTTGGITEIIVDLSVAHDFVLRAD